MFSKIHWIFALLIGITNIQANEPLHTIVLPSDMTTYTIGDFIDLELEDFGFPEKTNCTRTCEDGLNLICYLKMHVESYQAMGAACGKCASGDQEDCQNLQCITADGIEKHVVSINRKIPGPLIEACQNDLIVVDVYNHMHSDSLSIHWHGMLQKDTQYMDGVPFVTQCPIHPNNRFRYTFWAKESGTHFYHSHSGIQRYNGAYGGLIIRKPLSSNAASIHYDKDEHVMLLADWTHNAPELFYVGLPTRKPGPEALLINGKGKFLDPATQTFSPTPYETFYVTRELRYRFRIINAGSDSCPMELQIQDHNMTVISVDGNDVKPVTVDTLLITTGERFDVVVKADKNSGLYLIVVKLVGTCENQKIFQNAILSYEKSLNSNLVFSSSERNYDGYPRGDTMNDIFVPCDPPKNWCIKNLKALETNFDWFQPVDEKIYLKFSMRALEYPGFFGNSYNSFYNHRNDRLILGTINGISFHLPPHPLISQNDENDINKFCYDNTSLPEHCKDMQICTCTHIIDIPPYSFVELVLIDEEKDITLRVHPMHLHGFQFAVMAQGRLLTNGPLTEEIIKEHEALGLIKNNNTEPPLKDTIAVPNHGYAIIRFLTDNPGSWIFHCHIDYHAMFGMSAIVKVGSHVDVPPIPANFPRCGNF